ATAAADPLGQVGGAQQGVALFENLLVVGPHGGEPRLPGDEKLVDETAATVGIAAHQRDVLRREQDKLQRAEDVARTGGRRPAEPRLVRLTGLDLQLDEQLASTVDDFGA